MVVAVLGRYLVADPSLTAYGALNIYSTTSSLTMSYNMGVLALVFFTLQMLSGVVMAMSYDGSTGGAFSSLDLRDSYY